MTTYVLVPGMWIGAWAWRDVTAALRDAGHEVYPLTLTGVADRAHLLGPGTDLDLHTEDIVRLVLAEDLRDVVLVGHSYGGLPVSAAALRLKDRVARVVYVDSGPLPVGATQASMTPGPAPEGDSVPPREWDTEKDPALLAGLDEAALTLLRTRGTPHPAASVVQPLGARATSEDLPTTLVSCSLPIEAVTEMMAAGHPFFAGLTTAEIVPLPTGHWPMLSEPDALAGVLEKCH
ncbi:alpha/beta fold hydrolase [Amorphoplanes digitatis]|uniref:Pimeloyl-ACP methyl ester carboxylesterase n=1 Tax=Actinoplanes digitatis TaxID=1868 RepID=A0A7W7HV19_9ACTN|nr:alpha/beta hydrolase [Actinoplanes digitatis]MBB4761260.1 pimeloyl-ACP methyl ester carboxylesterase [Actinoplanes digitatis]